MASPDGTLTDAGEILEIDPPRRMVIRWQQDHGTQGTSRQSRVPWP
jgi:uncharacterized protein YndB with AHSA1/START domain